MYNNGKAAFRRLSLWDRKRVEETREEEERRYEWAKVERQILRISKDIDDALLIVDGGADMLEEMREAATNLEEGHTKGLHLMKHLTTINKVAHSAVTGRIVARIRNASESSIRRAIMTKALRDMAGSLEKFVVHSYKEHLFRGKYKMYLEDMLMQHERDPFDGGRTSQDVSQVRGQMLKDLLSKTTRFDAIQQVCKIVVEKKARREADANAGREQIAQQ